MSESQFKKNWKNVLKTKLHSIIFLDRQRSRFELSRMQYFNVCHKNVIMYISFNSLHQLTSYEK